MIRLLKIYGDDDYGALTWENLNISPEDTVKKIEESGTNTWEFEEGCYAELYEFDIGSVYTEEVEELVDFIKNEICDYDSLKHVTVVVVPEIQGGSNG